MRWVTELCAQSTFNTHHKQAPATALNPTTDYPRTHFQAPAPRHPRMRGTAPLVLLVVHMQLLALAKTLHGRLSLESVMSDVPCEVLRMVWR